MKTLFTIWLLAAAFLPVSAQGQQTPNVVFILTDDLGYYDLGCYGNPFNETPHIDGLARDGMKFTQAYSSSPRLLAVTGRTHDRNPPGQAPAYKLFGGRAERSGLSRNSGELEEISALG